MDDKHNNRKHLSSSLLEMHSFDQIQPDKQELKTSNEIDIENSTHLQILWMVTTKAFPLFLASLANVGCFTVTLVVTSRAVDNQYAMGAIGLGNMTLNMFLRSYVLGFNNSLVALLSQAFGAGHFVRMGHIINRSKILFLLCELPIFFCLSFIGTFLKLFGIEDELAYNTQFYVRISMFAFIFQLYFDIYRKILNSMRMFKVHSPIPFITLVLHFFWCYLLIHYLDLGLTGAAMAVIIQSSTNTLIIYFVVHCLGYGAEAFQPWGKEAFQGWASCLSKGVPTFFLQLFSFIAVEVIILLSGVLDIECLVANTSLVNLLYLTFLYAYCVSMSSSSMIGNKIGQGSKVGAQKLINSVFLFGLMFSCASMIFLYTFKSYIFSLYTIKESVLDKMNQMVYIYSLVLAFYILKETNISVIIGLGIQEKTVVFNIVSYLFIAIPISFYCTFALGWEYQGPWIGIALGNLMNSAYYYYLTVSHDLQWFIDEYKRKHASDETAREAVELSKSFNSSLEL